MILNALSAALFMLVLFPVTAYAHYDGELLPDSVAVMEYSMVLNMNPSDTLTRNKLGMVYVRQEKLEKAKEQFLEILMIAPEDFDALDSLGIVSEKQGDFGGAAEWYKKALEVKKGDPGASERYNSVLEKLKSGGEK